VFIAPWITIESISSLFGQQCKCNFTARNGTQCATATTNNKTQRQRTHRINATMRIGVLESLSVLSNGN
jgi:hypothetical protein